MAITHRCRASALAVSLAVSLSLSLAAAFTFTFAALALALTGGRGRACVRTIYFSNDGPSSETLRKTGPPPLTALLTFISRQIYILK